MHPKEMPYDLPEYVAQGAGEDRAGALTMFLLENTESISGCWIGRMGKADQITLFGQFIGKGRLFVDGQTEDVYMTVTTGYSGHLRDCVKSTSWVELCNRTIAS